MGLPIWCGKSERRRGCLFLNCSGRAWRFEKKFRQVAFLPQVKAEKERAVRLCGRAVFFHPLSYLFLKRKPPRRRGLGLAVYDGKN
jgi:hypothetical protein